MNDFLYVYVRKYPFEYKPTEPVLEEKKWEIKFEDNKKTQRRLYYEWLLLDEACKHVLKKNLNSLNPREEYYGRAGYCREIRKWTIDNYYIDFAHCNGFVMVAISSRPVLIGIRKTTKQYKEHMEWLFNNPSVLVDYVPGREPHTPYFNSLEKELLWKYYRGESFKYKEKLKIMVNMLEFDKELFISSNYREEYFYGICSELLKQNVDCRLYEDGLYKEDLSKKFYYHKGMEIELPFWITGKDKPQKEKFVSGTISSPVIEEDKYDVVKTITVESKKEEKQ